MEPSPLEVKYRRVLRVLPRPYRAVREQEMVATFLDNARDADRDNADLTMKFGSIGAAETMSVLVLALRLRWADPRAPLRYRVRAAGLRVFTLASVAILAATAVVFLVGSLVFVLAPPPEFATGSIFELLFSTADGWWFTLRMWAFVLWIPVLILATRGTRRSARAAVACAVVPTAVECRLLWGCAKLLVWNGRCVRRATLGV